MTRYFSCSLKITEVLQDRIRGYISETILYGITDELQSQFASKQLEIEQYREDTKEKERLIYTHKKNKETLERELEEVTLLSSSF